MEEILSLVAEVEEKAVAILNLAKEEKEKFKEEELQRRHQFEQSCMDESEKRIKAYRKELEQKLLESSKLVDEDLKKKEINLCLYYKQNKDMIVKSLVDQVIGE
ncbi:MAG: hypothetical protein E7256_11960 [Lachnospiraceae bacterium]|nr:hypothetical protein [Lachnospiraceae bacterium]